MGRSLCAVQVLEHMLAYYLGLWADLPPNESRELVESSLELTLGTLHKRLRKFNLVPEGLEDRLTTYREERNWLVHHVYSQSWEDQFSPSKAPKLLQRIDAVHDEAKQLTTLFDQLNDDWMTQNGYDAAQLQAIMDQRLHEIATQN